MNMEITEKSESTNIESVSETAIDFSKVNVNINAQFLANFKNILDASIERGTWKGNELTQIGSIYQNINGVLQKITEKLQSGDIDSLKEEELETIKEA
jgi:hypothetical protein